MNLMNFNVDGNTPKLVDAALMGRAARKFENAEDVLAALSRAATVLQLEESSYFCGSLAKPESTYERPFRCGTLAGRVKKGQVTSAKPLIATRLKFPGPPQFDPVPFFDEETARRFSFPLQLAKNYEEFEGEVPKVRVFADRYNRVELYRKLAESGRLLPVPAAMRRGPFFSGMFAVPKNMEKDRLVLDGRPANALEAPQNLWCATMASPMALAMMYLSPGRVLLSSGEDLRDYFYQFKVPFERCARNMLSDPVSLEEARYIFGEKFSSPDAEIWVGLNSLAMGDSMASEFAQGSHTGLMLQHGVAEVHQLLSLYNPLPRGLQHVGIIIDDLVVLEQVLLAELKEIRAGARASWGASTALKAREAYLAVGLETNPAKAFCDEELGSFWGVDVDGNKGIIRAANARLWPAMMITMRVATLRLATVGLLEALAGIWVALLGIRRGLFCLLDIIFEPLGIADQRQVVRLSEALVDELMSVVVMAPMAMVNLRAPYAPFLVATDASLTGLAAVRAPLGSLFSQELCRHSLRKSCWSTLLPPGKSWKKQHGLLEPEDELDDAEESFQVHPLWELCARGCSFSTTWSSRADSNLHINLLEMKAHLREERRLARNGRSLRVPQGLDSQVCLGALVKGRASSTALTREMRKGLGYGIGSDLYNFYMFFPSSFNRADGPSRGEDPALPDVVLPVWWDEAQEGSFERMDKWLEAASEFTAMRDLPYELLMDPSNSLVAPARRNKKSRRKRRRKSPLPAGVELRDKSGGEKVDGAGVSSSLSCPAEATTLARRIELLRSIPRKQFYPQKGELDFSAVGALDLFSGSCGVAKQLVKMGAPWVLTYELKRGDDEDLLDPRNQAVIQELFGLGAFSGAGMGPVCASFSRAVTPAVRSRRFPRGLPKMSSRMRAKVQEGNKMADFVFWVWQFCLEHVLWFWVENPDTSFLWLLKGWERFAEASSPWVFRLSYCRFGTRIGEAANPGPARSRQSQTARETLEGRPLLLPATLQLERRLLDDFLCWCKLEVKSVSLEVLFNKSPELLAVLLRTYGDLLYQRGGALSNLRHLLLAAQRWKPLAKPFMQMSWDMVYRWEALQPVQHRTPLPESVVRAMCVLAWNLGWFGWATATAISFYGGARVGELLKCLREDLLLPTDLAEEGFVPVFVRIRHFKSKHRTPAQVQHLKVRDVTTCKLLHLVFRKMHKDTPLFPTTPYQFRKRWNLLLEMLAIPADANLTPGGLRGGFAVMAYRAGFSVQDIMWAMRLRSQVTLESYLQETASLNALVSLPSEARKALGAAAKVFPFLPAACS
eukprot:s2178_g6.t1